MRVNTPQQFLPVFSLKMLNICTVTKSILTSKSAEKAI